MARQTTKPRASAREFTLTGIRSLRGKSARGAILDFSQGWPAARASAPELKINKPRTTRYPISLEEFARRKSVAATTTVRLNLRDSVVVADKKRPQLRELAGLAMPAAPPPSGPGPSGALTPMGNFRGIPATGWLPPDCTMAAGPNHIVLAANSSIAIYSKAGGAALQQRTLAAWFSNVTSNTSIFDPKLLYDQHAARWVLLAVAISADNKSLFLLSASETADPTGRWRNYALDAARDGATKTNNWADYPGLGIDAHAFYLTANMFRVGGGFAYAKIRIVPKAPVYAGGAATFVDLVKMKNPDNTLAFTMQPCHTYGAPQAQYFVNSLFPKGNKLSVWSLTNPLTNPTLTVRSLEVSPYDMPPDADQKGGNLGLDSGDVRILHAVFRGGSIWTALTTRHIWSTGGSVAAVHWFQIDPAAGALVQQGIFGAGGRHYFYPALAPDNNGNAVLVFSVSSSNEFASIYFTGRAATDPVGQLRPGLMLKAGTANYVGTDDSGRNRWGDYAGVAGDPATPATIWFYSMFVEAANKWGTWVGSAQL